jgi:death-on-curing protein
MPTAMAANLHYLTVQDVLWINLQATKKVNHFNFARLEEATYYQYAYGDSNTLLPQAARFVTGFLKMRPLDAGNEVTAFIALLAFLKINGQRIDLNDKDGSAWFERVGSGVKAARQAIGETVSEDHDAHAHGPEDLPDIPAAIGSVLESYPLTVAALLENATVQAA